MMKDWLREHGISYRQLAMDMGTSVSSVCKKLNQQTPWREKDLRWLFAHYGLSADFVIGKSEIPYRAKEME